MIVLLSSLLLGQALRAAREIPSCSMHAGLANNRLIAEQQDASHSHRVASLFSLFCTSTSASANLLLATCEGSGLAARSGIGEVREAV